MSIKIVQEVEPFEGAITFRLHHETLSARKGLHATCTCVMAWEGEQRNLVSSEMGEN